MRWRSRSWLRAVLLALLIPGAALLATNSCMATYLRAMSEALNDAARDWDPQEDEEDLGDWIDNIGDFFDSDDKKG